MKQLFLLLSLTFLSIPVQAQQVTEFQECTRTREVYVPGYYDGYGNYQQGYVNTERYNVPCNGGYGRYNRYNSDYRPNRGVYCDPTKTALGGILGGGIAASMSRGDGYKWSVPLGVFLGGAAFGCN
jgi:hypothetical protein